MSRTPPFVMVMIILSLWLAPAGFTFAQEQNLEVVLQALQQRIRDLEKQIVELRVQLELVQKAEVRLSEIYKFTKTLQRGMTGEEVRELQEFLTQFPDIYPEGLITGYFGTLTEAAVKRIQEKNGIEAVGIVGPKTREKLNEIVTSGGSSSVMPSEAQKQLTDIAPSIMVAPSGVTPAVPAIPATPATPATPPSGGGGGGGGGATPATPATPAEPASPPVVDTTPPIISDIQVTNITETSATIGWITNEPASSEVHYSLYSPVVATTTPAVGTDGVTSHSVNLPNLTASKTYYYFVVSKDSNSNTATSSEQSFTTLTPPPPVSNWSNVKITNFSGNGNIYYGQYPALAWNDSGYGVVWEGSDGTPVEQTGVENLFFKKIGSDGNSSGNHVRITNHGYCGCLTAGAPGIIWNGSKYAVAWTDHKDPTETSRPDGQNTRFVTLDANGNTLTDIYLYTDGNAGWGRPKLKWMGSTFAITWRVSRSVTPSLNEEVDYYAEVAEDGQTILISNRLATIEESSLVNTPSFTGRAISDSGEIYFNDTNVTNELVSVVGGSNSLPHITWSGSQYAIVWMNVFNNQIQLYLGTK